CSKDFKKDQIVLINQASIEKSDEPESKKPKVSNIKSIKQNKKISDLESQKSSYKNSSVYKSLFNSANSKDNLEKAPWITYNPYYN
ncbi:MAG: Protein RTF2, partial [Paramarteilia canceri]